MHDDHKSLREAFEKYITPHHRRTSSFLRMDIKILGSVDCDFFHRGLSQGMYIFPGGKFAQLPFSGWETEISFYRSHFF